MNTIVIIMPSSQLAKFTVKVDNKLKAKFKALCQQENISASKAIQNFMSRSVALNDLSSSHCHSTELAATYFANRELETLTSLAANYSEMLSKYNSLQKRILQLEELLHKV